MDNQFYGAMCDDQVRVRAGQKMVGGWCACVPLLKRDAGFEAQGCLVHLGLVTAALSASFESRANLFSFWLRALKYDQSEDVFSSQALERS